MADLDKENRAPALEPHTASKGRLDSAANSTSKTIPGKASQQPGVVAFPAEDPDEDRDVLDSNGKTLRSKRSVLFYPSANLAAKSNQAPFSRSAAKRESILALGSIGYLQHLYTKQGIANRNRPTTKGAMALAIGPAGEAMFAASEGSELGPSLAGSAFDRSAAGDVVEEEEECETFALPPSPKAATYSRPKFLDVARPLEADSQALRTLLVQDMRRLLTVWDLSEWVATDLTVTPIKQLLSEGATNPGASSVDNRAIETLTIIDVTTKVVRSVRSYVLSLPQRSKITSTSPNEPNGRDRYKRQSSFSAVSRPGQIGTPVPTRTSEIFHHDVPAEDSALTHPSGLAVPRRASTSQEADCSDHLSILRKAALELLSALKDMETRNRVETLGSDEEPKKADASASSDNGTVPTIITGDPDDSRIDAVAIGTGYLYRQDLKPTDLGEERKTLQDYLQTVSSVLAALAESNREGWKANRRHSSSSHAEAEPIVANGSATSEPLNRSDAAEETRVEGGTDTSPVWTRNDLKQARVMSSFIMDHCEAAIGKDLSQSRLDGVRAAENDMPRLLSCLCDGYLLCKAFNEAVRRSDKPWGYIASREMHDLQAEEAAIMHKEALRAKEAQDSEAPTFQTRTDRRNASEGSIAAGGTPSGANATSSRPGWTFRRSENLRVWAAALKLRYHIQTTATKASSKRVARGPTYGSLGMGKLALHGRRVASESQASSSPTNEPKNQRTIDFDSNKIARKEDGWQEMLATLLCAWIEAVAHEQGYAQFIPE